MVIHNMVRIRYPELLELAQKRIEQIDSPEVLNFLYALCFAHQLPDNP